jgi:predicted  nucleic acid-binding Zn-ribbon protein
MEGLWNELLRAQGLAVLAIGFLLSWGGFALNARIKDLVSGKADAGQVSALAGRIDAVEDKLVRIESQLAHLPGAEDLARLEVQLERCNGALSAIAATTEGVSRMLEAQGRRVELIDEHLKRAHA